MKPESRIVLTWMVSLAFLTSSGLEAADLKGSVLDLGMLEKSGSAGIGNVEVTVFDAAREKPLAATVLTTSGGDYLITGLPKGRKVKVVFDHLSYQRRNDDRFQVLAADMNTLDTVYMVRTGGSDVYLAGLANVLAEPERYDVPSIEEARNLVDRLGESDRAFIFDRLGGSDFPNVHLRDYKKLHEEVRPTARDKVDPSKSDVKTQGGGGGGGGGGYDR